MVPLRYCLQVLELISVPMILGAKSAKGRTRHLSTVRSQRSRSPVAVSAPAAYLHPFLQYRGSILVARAESRRSTDGVQPPCPIWRLLIVSCRDSHHRSKLYGTGVVTVNVTAQSAFIVNERCFARALRASRALASRFRSMAVQCCLRRQRLTHR